MASENPGQAAQTGGRFLPPRSTLDEPLSPEHGVLQAAPPHRSATKTESGISVTRPATASSGFWECFCGEQRRRLRSERPTGSTAKGDWRGSSKRVGSSFFLVVLSPG